MSNHNNNRTAFSDSIAERKENEGQKNGQDPLQQCPGLPLSSHWPGSLFQPLVLCAGPGTAWAPASYPRLPHRTAANGALETGMARGHTATLQGTRSPIAALLVRCLPEGFSSGVGWVQTVPESTLLAPSTSHLTQVEGRPAQPNNFPNTPTRALKNVHIQNPEGTEKD